MILLAGLMDEISVKVYDALAYHVSQSHMNQQRMKAVSLWSLQKTAAAVMSVLRSMSDPMSAQMKEAYIHGQLPFRFFDAVPLVSEVYESAGAG